MTIQPWLDDYVETSLKLKLFVLILMRDHYLMFCHTMAGQLFRRREIEMARTTKQPSTGYQMIVVSVGMLKVKAIINQLTNCCSF